MASRTRKTSDPKKYDECREDVTRPGKFEGEAVYVPYFWEAYLDGFADRDDGRTIGFNVSAEDKAIFPELRGRKTVRLVEDGAGFVREV